MSLRDPIDCFLDAPSDAVAFALRGMVKAFEAKEHERIPRLNAAGPAQRPCPTHEDVIRVGVGAWNLIKTTVEPEWCKPWQSHYCIETNESKRWRPRSPAVVGGFSRSWPGGHRAIRGGQ